MKTPIRNTLFTLTLFAMLASGCANRAIHLPGNWVLVRPNGQTIIKGFGDGKAKSVVCTLNPGPYGSENRQKTEAGVDVVKYVAAKVSSESASKSVLLFAQSENLQALDAIMSQVCIAYGNGAFGSIGDPKAQDRYFAEIQALLKATAPVASPEVNRKDGGNPVDKNDTNQAVGDPK